MCGGGLGRSLLTKYQQHDVKINVVNVCIYGYLFMLVLDRGKVQNLY